ncbi:hypothetical protein GCM10025872_28460 [Barrientosiimonas endolithica]|uniref:glycine--tRNA ligase n=1 Tax=Barrientosiimonas endolithica TaxID=1535208 RepID=A0ABM8HDW9_9MICO|nr:hypothetical protein GCM10025872_28460 [Barrientosiimonas endolithica]
MVGRFGQALRDEGVPVGLVNAVQALAEAPGTAEQALRDIQQLAGDPQLAPTVEAVQRITRIVPAETAPTYDRALLASDAEDALAVYVEELPDHARDGLPAWLPDAHRLVAPLTTFFDDVLVMDPDEQVRAARLGLLQTIVDRAPAGIDWKALDSAL